MFNLILKKITKQFKMQVLPIQSTFRRTHKPFELYVYPFLAISQVFQGKKKTSNTITLLFTLGEKDAMKKDYIMSQKICDVVHNLV